MRRNRVECKHDIIDGINVIKEVRSIHLLCNEWRCKIYLYDNIDASASRLKHACGIIKERQKIINYFKSQIFPDVEIFPNADVCFS